MDPAFQVRQRQLSYVYAISVILSVALTVYVFALSY